MTGKPFSLSVKAVIIDGQNRCLLLRRSPSSKHFAEEWEWPGGKVDPGESFADAVVRETREETLLSVEITGLAGAMEFEMPHVNVVQLCMEVHIVVGEVKLSDEHDDFVWAPLADLAKWNLLEHMKSFMLDYAKKKGATS